MIGKTLNWLQPLTWRWRSAKGCPSIRSESARARSQITAKFEDRNCPLPPEVEDAVIRQPQTRSPCAGQAPWCPAAQADNCAHAVSSTLRPNGRIRPQA